MGKEFGFPGGTVGKDTPANAGDTIGVGSVPGSGRSLGQEMQPTPVFWPGKFHGQRHPLGYSPWGCKESDMTEHALFKKEIHYLIILIENSLRTYSC